MLQPARLPLQVISAVGDCPLQALKPGSVIPASIELVLDPASSMPATEIRRGFRFGKMWERPAFVPQARDYGVVDSLSVLFVQPI
jgi:hypothetical protein